MQESTIDQLAPIIPPETVSFWPLQPAWYVLIGLVLILIGLGIYRYLKYRKKNRYRLIALQEIENIKSQDAGGTELIVLNTILKATALQGFPRSAVASLYGEEWLNFLDSTATGSNFQEAGDILVNAAFQKAETLEIKSHQWKNLLDMSKYWIKKHKFINKHHG